MTTKEDRTATQFVGTILALLYSKDYTQLPSDKVSLHSVFYELGKTNADIYHFLEFDTRKPHPYSLALDEALGNIQASNALGRLNPGMTEFVLRSPIESYKSMFTQPELDRLGKIADELKDILH